MAMTQEQRRMKVLIQIHYARKKMADGKAGASFWTRGYIPLDDLLAAEEQIKELRDGLALAKAKGWIDDAVRLDVKAEEVEVQDEVPCWKYEFVREVENPDGALPPLPRDAELLLDALESMSSMLHTDESGGLLNTESPEEAAAAELLLAELQATGWVDQSYTIAEARQGGQRVFRMADVRGVAMTPGRYFGRSER
jgi:hypothetical protein